MPSDPAPSDPTAPMPGPARAPRVADRYPHLGTAGVSVSSSAGADVSVTASRLEGWLVAVALLGASALAMGIYVVVLHH